MLMVLPPVALWSWSRSSPPVTVMLPMRITALAHDAAHRPVDGDVADVAVALQVQHGGLVGGVEGDLEDVGVAGALEDDLPVPAPVSVAVSLWPAASM